MNASASIWGNRICVSTYAGSVFCLDRRNGRKLWSTYIKRNTFSYESFYASPSTDGLRLYTTSRAGKVVALSAKSGRVLWTYQMGGWGYATPAIADGRVYVGGFDGRLRSFRGSDGRVLWDTAIGGKILAGALVVGKLVFVSTLDRDTYALRTSDGKIVWHKRKGAYAPGSPLTGVTSSPLGARSTRTEASGAFPRSFRKAAGDGAARAVNAGRPSLPSAKPTSGRDTC